MKVQGRCQNSLRHQALLRTTLGLSILLDLEAPGSTKLFGHYPRIRVALEVPSYFDTILELSWSIYLVSSLQSTTKGFGIFYLRPLN